MKGDLNSVAEKHISDSRDIKLKAIDVKIELAEEQIKRIKMDLLDNQVKQENLKTDNIDIPVVYNEQEIQLNNEISILNTKLENSRNEKIRLQ